MNNQTFPKHNITANEIVRAKSRLSTHSFSIIRCASIPIRFISLQSGKEWMKKFREKRKIVWKLQKQRRKYPSDIIDAALPTNWPQGSIIRWCRGEFNQPTKFRQMVNKFSVKQSRDNVTNQSCLINDGHSVIHCISNHSLKSFLSVYIYSFIFFHLFVCVGGWLVGLGTEWRLL